MANENRIITLQNIDDEDFMFEYNSSEGNPPYVIPAGEIARFPQFLAEHALKHLIDKILTKNEQKTNSESLRMELANQIIIGEENAQRGEQLTEAQKLQKEVEEMNKPTTLEGILEKRKAEQEHKEDVEAEEEGEKVSTETFEGLEDDEPKKDARKEKREPDVIKAKDGEAAPLPTRAELYLYAEKEVNMILDDKSKKKFDKMKVTELVKELDFPLNK